MIASVIPPPPPRSPPSATPHLPTVPASSSPTLPTAPLPLRVVQESRESSVDRLSGPIQPRRIVPQTPEERERDLDDDDDDREEVKAEEQEVVDGDEDAGSELARSTLFVPPPKVGKDEATAYRTVMDREVDEGEESEPPLRVPPPLSVVEEVGRGGVVDREGVEVVEGMPLPIRVDVNVGGEGQVAKPSRSVPPPPPFATAEEERDDSGSEYDDDDDGEEAEEEVLRTRPFSGEQTLQGLVGEGADEQGVPLVVPPRLSEGGGVRHAPVRGLPPPPPMEEEEKEVLDEDEGGECL